METVILARNAMNTRFELVLHGANPASLRAAAEQALAEVERIESQLSLFRSSSEIARVNALAVREAVRVSPEVFALLRHAEQMTRETGGTFDITLAPLLRCWGLLGRSDGQVPTHNERTAARAVCGMGLVALNPDNYTVRFARDGVMLDLGAIGKGYAVEKAAEILREAGVGSALIHGGTSTVYALGTPPEADAWKIAIEAPHARQPLTRPVDPPLPIGWGEGRGEKPAGQPKLPLATILLRDESLSVSAISGKCFVAEDHTLGHIIDPRTGAPASNALLAAVVLPSGTETDALSTALLVVGPAGHDRIAALRPGMRTLLASGGDAGSAHCLARGIEPTPPPAV